MQSILVLLFSTIKTFVCKGVQCLLIVWFLFCLDETQLVEGSSTSEQQSDPGPDPTKEVDPNHPTDGAQEPECTKEMEALALQPESPLESETALDDIDVQKIQDSEE